MATPTNKQVAEWLKTKDATTLFFRSGINKDLAQCVGIYSRRNGRNQPRAVGGQSSYGIKALTFLVHWTANADTCEEKAQQLIDLFRTAGTTEVIGSNTGYFLALQDPVDVGRDEKGIFERTFDIDFIYRK